MKLCNVPARLTLLIERSSHHFRWIVSPVFTKQRIEKFFQFSSVKLRVGKSYLYHLETKQPKCWMLWLVHTSSCNFTLQLGYLKDGNVFRFVQILYLLCVEQLRLSVAHHSYYETSLCNELLTNRARLNLFCRLRVFEMLLILRGMRCAEMSAASLLPSL